MLHEVYNTWYKRYKHKRTINTKAIWIIYKCWKHYYIPLDNKNSVFIFVFLYLIIKNLWFRLYYVDVLFLWNKFWLHSGWDSKTVYFTFLVVSLVMSISWYTFSVVFLKGMQWMTHTQAPKIWLPFQKVKMCSVSGR